MDNNNSVTVANLQALDRHMSQLRPEELRQMASGAINSFAVASTVLLLTLEKLQNNGVDLSRSSNSLMELLKLMQMGNPSKLSITVGPNALDLARLNDEILGVQPAAVVNVPAAQVIAEEVQDTPRANNVVAFPGSKTQH